MQDATRALPPAPSHALDAATGAARFGSYRGGAMHVDLAPLARGPLARIAREKRWAYVAIASDHLLVAVAAIRFGYASNAFAYAYDRRARRMLVTRSALGPPFAGRVAASTDAGSIATFAMPHARVRFERRGETYRLDARFPDLVVNATLRAEGTCDPITAIAPTENDGATVTEKRALLAARGEARILGTAIPLGDALAGYDYTHGLLARRTAWRWAFALGTAVSGERVALNLVEGFVGAPECALWIDGVLHPLAEGRFTFDAARPTAPWRVRTADGAVDLRFEPGGTYEDDRQLGVVATRFVQVAGTFHGTIAVPGRAPLVLDGVVGVTEDQDSRW